MLHWLVGKAFLYSKGVWDVFGHHKYVWHPSEGTHSIHHWCGVRWSLILWTQKKDMSLKFYTPKKYLASQFSTQKNARLKYFNTDLLSAFFPELARCWKKVQMNYFVIYWSQQKLRSEMCKPQKICFYIKA